MRREKLTGLVLSKRNIGEADRLLTLFTEEQGIKKVLAKGVRKIPSKRGGHMESLTEVLMVVSGSWGRAYLARVETLDYFRELHEDEDAIRRAQGMARAIVNLFHEEEKNENIYDLVRDTWEAWPTLEVAKRDLLEVGTLLALLNGAGLLPRLDVCLECGRDKVGDGMALVLDASIGGWRCLSCVASLQQARNSLTSRGLAVLRFVIRQPNQMLNIKIKKEESGQIVQVLRRYMVVVMRMQDEWSGARRQEGVVN